MLGIDPGSRLLGFGIVERSGSRLRAIAAGTLVGRGQSFVARLVPMLAALEQLVETHRPQTLAIETAFAGKNVHSALVLGQVRGAIVVRLASLGLAVYEYAPAQIKQAATGNGAADKEQVQRMVRLLLGLKEAALGLDASDALAAAICHAQRPAGPPGRRSQLPQMARPT